MDDPGAPDAPATEPEWPEGASLPDTEPDGNEVAAEGAVETFEEGGAVRSGPPCLILVTERPELFEGMAPQDRLVLRWDSTPDASMPIRHGSRFQGDPGDPETYLRAMRRAGDIVAVVDLTEADAIRRTVSALNTALPAAAVLVLSEDETLELPSSGATRRVQWSQLLEPDIESELARLANLRRLNAFREFAAGAGLLPILIQRDPDPDAMASALALRKLLRRTHEDAPIVSLGEITRPENRRMAELLRIRVTQVTEAELGGFERIATVDVQPVDVPGGPRLAVIDHHPREKGYRAEALDIRPAYGATATILTEYLRADDERWIDESLATALLYGLKTDTAALSRGVAPADVAAYAFLQARADPELLSGIERPSYPIEVMRALGKAVAELAMDEDACVAWMGDVRQDQVHVLPALADLCLGVQGSSWVAAAGRVCDDLIINIRYVSNDDESGAGEVARRLAGSDGSGGGHATMARCVLPIDGAEWLRQDEEAPAGKGSGPAHRLLERLRREIEAIGAR